MLVFEYIPMALTGLRTNKMRSILTMLGIIIGIASVMTIVSVITGHYDGGKFHEFLHHHFHGIYGGKQPYPGGEAEERFRGGKGERYAFRRRECEKHE